MDTGFLLMSVLWSGVGAGFWIYGKKQRSMAPLFGGMALIGISWVITSPLWMTVTALGIIGAIWYFSRME